MNRQRSKKFHVPSSHISIITKICLYEDNIFRKTNRIQVFISRSTYNINLSSLITLEVPSDNLNCFIETEKYLEKEFFFLKRMPSQFVNFYES